MITVLKPGMLTTVQDRGRWGWQHLGVPPAGPMDPLSFGVANRLAGNDDTAAALEVTLIGPQLRFERSAVVALAGADLSASIPLGRAILLDAGSVLRFGTRVSGTRVYVAVRGGLDVPGVLGSRATSLSSRLPGLAGRAIRAGDTLPIGETGAAPRAGEPVPPVRLPQPAALRFIWGPDDDAVAEAARLKFVESEYRLLPQSNRMGYRLDGWPVVIGSGGQWLSEASPTGSIQITPSGQPILLMADRQTTGGYPRIGTVITADLAAAGQLGPGDRLRFQPCDPAVALEALRAQRKLLDNLGRPAE